jgi:hypothetical protein
MIRDVLGESGANNFIAWLWFDRLMFVSVGAIVGMAVTLAVLWLGSKL